MPFNTTTCTLIPSTGYCPHPIQFSFFQLHLSLLTYYTHYDVYFCPSLVVRIFVYFLKFVYLFLAELGLHCYLGFFSTWGTWTSHRNSLSWCRAWVLGQVSLRSFSTQAQQVWLPGSWGQAQQLRSVGLAAPQHVDSCWPRDGTCVSCIGRFFTTETPGKPLCLFFKMICFWFTKHLAQ